jgi:excisionase family DNA binding protein
MFFAPQPGLEWRGEPAIASTASRQEHPFMNSQFGMYAFGELAIRNFEWSEKWGTYNEASEYLNIPKTTLYQYSCQRKIPYSKPGRRLLYRKADLDEFVLNNRREDVGA